MRVIHFEGLPGSGKTTAASQFCEVLRSNGVDANWWREEASDHPVRGRDIGASLQPDDYPHHYLNAWKAFVESSSGTVVLDGYALQSTVRFMFAHHLATRNIENYFNAWQALAPDETIVYLLVNNPEEHCEAVLAERGHDWSNKLYRYTERTPVGIANGLQGKSGFIEFWSDYQRLCLRLLEDADIPVYFIDARSWNRDDLKVLAVETGYLPE
jgi:thymidylate kinase